MNTGKKKKLNWTPYCYLIPCMLVFAIFLFYPFFKTIYLSLYYLPTSWDSKVLLGHVQPENRLWVGEIGNAGGQHGVPVSRCGSICYLNMNTLNGNMTFQCPSSWSICSKRKCTGGQHDIPTPLVWSIFYPNAMS